MTDREIVKHISNGADYYVSMFGKAEHMENVDNGFYSYVKPKGDEHGISIIYNIRMDDLPREKQKELVAEMKALHMPIWLDLFASDELFFLFFGKNRVHGQTEFADDDEIYMALLAGEKAENLASNEKVIKVQSPEEFAAWAQVANAVLANGYPDMHPVYHYPLCRDGFMKCYMIYNENEPVAVASSMDNNGIASLEFVATIPKMRRCGYARAVCERAVQDAFADGAKIVTVRAVDAVASKLYQSIGFKGYNYVL